jgi:type VII secretion effector (TIGR04197 family)
MIESNLASAEEIATEMGQASDSTERATQRTINRADRTTLSVNQQAQSANELAKELTQSFNQVFRQTIQNIQLTAEEFERTDNELQNIFGTGLHPSPYFEDVITYQRAKNG